jgi:hypothetical protein
VAPRRLGVEERRRRRALPHARLLKRHFELT